MRRTPVLFDFASKLYHLKDQAFSVVDVLNDFGGVKSSMHLAANDLFEKGFLYLVSKKGSKEYLALTPKGKKLVGLCFWFVSYGSRYKPTKQHQFMSFIWDFYLGKEGLKIPSDMDSSFVNKNGIHIIQFLELTRF